MKRLLIAGALCLAVVPAAYPQDAADAPATPASATSAADGSGPSREELEDRIETSALRLVEKVLNAIGDEIPETEKQEILAEVRSEMEAEKEAGSNAAAGDKMESGGDLEEKIEAGILRLVEKVISAVGDDLSEEEKQEILSEVRSELKSESDVRDGNFSIKLDSGGDHGMGVIDAIVPVVAIVIVFGTPVFIVIAVLYAGYRKRRLVQETISQYLASGKDVPPEILESIHGGAERPKNYLQKGFVMVGAGAGIFLAFAIMGSMEAASLGLIPLFIGIAQLLIWKLEKPGNDARG